MAAISLCLLGPFEACYDAELVALRRQPRAILAYLVARRQPCRRQALIDLFCCEAQDPAGALRLHLSRIRRQLGTASLLTEDNTVQFNPAAAWVDLLIFQQQLDCDLAGQLTETLQAGLELYRGDFLDGLSLADAPEFELWLLGERARLRRLYQRGLDEMVTRLIDQGNHQAAIRWAQQHWQIDPLLEAPPARLMRLYALTGQRTAALDLFDHYRTLLRQELAVEPTADLIALRDQIAANQLDLNKRAAPVTIEPIPKLGQAAGFVGRGTELARLRQAWQVTCSGQGSLVLLEAEAGGGKTRLITEFSQDLAEIHLLTGRCYESTADLPLYPWIEILEAKLTRLTDDQLRHLPTFTQTTLVRLLPALARRLALDYAFIPGETGDLNRVFAAATDFLLASLDGPLAVFVDDLQWADEGSLRFFRYLALRLTHQPLLLIGAFRSEEVANLPAFQALLNDLERRLMVRLRLTALSQPSIHVLIDQIWSHLPAEDRNAVVERITQATGGNALFVTELVRELSRHQAIPAALPVPPTVRDLIRQRLQRLPESSRQVIETLAILGIPANVTDIQQCSGRSEEETVAAINQAIQLGLLVERLGAEFISYDFRHDLLREAVGSQVIQIRARLLHRRAATFLAHRAAYLPTGARQEAAARIIRHAIASEAFDLILAWGLPAADYAMEAYASTEALQALTAAMTAFGHLRIKSDFDSGTAEHQLLQVLLRWIQIIALVGRPLEEIKTNLDRAADLLARHPDERLQAQFLYCQAIYHNKSAHYDRAEQLACEAAERYLNLGLLSLAAQSFVLAAWACITISRNEVGRQLYSTALTLYRQESNYGGESSCLSGLAWAAINLSEIEVAIDYFTQVQTLSRHRQDILTLADAEEGLAITGTFYLDYEKTRAWAESAIHRYRQLGFEAMALRPLIPLGFAHTAHGDMVQARKILGEAFQQARVGRDTWAEGWVAQALGRMALAQGDLPQAEFYLELAYTRRQAAGERQNQISDMIWLSRLALAKGEPETALDYSSRGIMQLEAQRGEFYVFQAWDLLLGHAEALQANQLQTEAADFLRRAYDELMHFAAQIKDPQTKANFLSNPFNTRLLTAYESSWIKPVHPTASL